MPMFIIVRTKSGKEHKAAYSMTGNKAKTAEQAAEGFNATLDEANSPSLRVGAAIVMRSEIESIEFQKT